MRLSENIKRLRLEKKLTQEQLAGLLRVSSQAVSKWENSDTYPDGSLLVPLSEILGVSLDELFGNESIYLNDILKKTELLLTDADRKEQFNIAQKIGWHTEYGLFNSHLRKYERKDFDVDNIEIRTLPSYILSDYGFTHISNGDEPFFSLFPEPKEGFGGFVKDMDDLQNIFSSLSSEITLRAIVYLLRQNIGYTFEPEALAEVCDIENGELDRVMSDLLVLNAVNKNELFINGEPRILYSTNPMHKLIAVFLMAKELTYRGAYCVKAARRSLPLIK